LLHTTVPGTDAYKRNTAAVEEELHREAALITSLVTLSGVVIAGIGSAFSGVVAGALALFVEQYGQAKTHIS